MAGTMLDEALTEGLKQAKKGPRNFALIVKGANPVKLMVRKKKFRDGELAKAKTEAKGNDYISGVLVVSGADFAFQVLAEPAVKPLKLKELITEQTEMTAKPRWEVLPTLPDIGGDEDDEQSEVESQDGAPPIPPPTGPLDVEDERQESESDEAPQSPPPPPGSPPTAPPPPAIDAKQLIAAMNKLSPQIQAAAAANPDRKAELVQPVATFQQHIKSGKLAEAKAVLAQLAALLKTLSAPTSTDTGKTSGPFVAFQKSRLDWDSTRKAVQAELQKLEKSILDQCQSEEDFSQIAAGTKNLYTMLDTLDTRLIDKLDEALNAETENARQGKQLEALEIVDEYLDFVEDDDLLGDIDDNGFTGVNIHGRLVATLNDLAKRLAV